MFQSFWNMFQKVFNYGNIFLFFIFYFYSFIYKYGVVLIYKCSIYIYCSNVPKVPIIYGYLYTRRMEYPNNRFIKTTK